MAFVSSLTRGSADSAPAALPADGLFAHIITARGQIVCELFYRQAPLTVSSFVGLAEGTFGPSPRHPFFDGLKFHRVVPGFVIQGGDPLGTGEGGPGYTFPDEFIAGLRHDSAGILSMANSGPDTNGSQFFITLAPVPRLNYLHSVFGRVVTGLDVLPQIQAGDGMRLTIERRGDAAKKFHPTADSFANLWQQAPRATPQAFDDPNGLLQTDPPRAKTLNYKLENFTRFQGRRFFFRIFESFTPDSNASDPAAWTKNLAAELHLLPDDTLVVYFTVPGKVENISPRRSDLRMPTVAPEPPGPPAENAAAQVDLKKKRLAAVNEIADSVIYQLETEGKPPNRAK